MQISSLATACIGQPLLTFWCHTEQSWMFALIVAALKMTCCILFCGSIVLPMINLWIVAAVTCNVHLVNFFVRFACSLFSMDVETTNPIHHLIFGGGIVRGCTVLCVIDIMYGHRWDTDKRSCFLCSEQHIHAVGDAHLQFYPALLA